MRFTSVIAPLPNAKALMLVALVTFLVTSMAFEETKPEGDDRAMKPMGATHIAALIDVHMRTSTNMTSDLEERLIPLPEVAVKIEKFTQKINQAAERLKPKKTPFRKSGIVMSDFPEWVENVLKDYPQTDLGMEEVLYRMRVMLKGEVNVAQFLLGAKHFPQSRKIADSLSNRLIEKWVQRGLNPKTALRHLGLEKMGVFQALENVAMNTWEDFVRIYASSKGFFSSNGYDIMFKTLKEEYGVLLLNAMRRTYADSRETNFGGRLYSRKLKEWCAHKPNHVMEDLGITVKDPFCQPDYLIILLDYSVAKTAKGAIPTRKSVLNHFHSDFGYTNTVTLRKYLEEPPRKWNEFTKQELRDFWASLY